MNHNIELLKFRLLQLMDITTEDAMFRRINGLDWNGYTMIGLRRLDNLEMCINSVINNEVPGAIVEAGVWRGGACIFANGVLKELGEERNIYVCDIFDNTFPKPQYECDGWSDKHDFSALSVSLEDVKDNFDKFGLLTDNVIFKKGWFNDTLKTIKEPVSILRIDGDTYQSTIESLQLEKNIPSGGFIIMDDWSIECSRRAFIDYFSDNGTEKDVIKIDYYGAYWQKP